MIDYIDLLGVQFAYGGRGPDTYDCYGLVMECARRAGTQIPDVRSPDVLPEIAKVIAAEKYRWTRHARKPATETIPLSVMLPGRVIEVRVNGLACHVGYIHRPRRFLHTMEKAGGVVDEDLVDWKNRILGVYEYGG